MLALGHKTGEQVICQSYAHISHIKNITQNKIDILPPLAHKRYKNVRLLSPYEK